MCSAAHWSGTHFVLFKHKMSTAEMGQLQHFVSTTPFADTACPRLAPCPAKHLTQYKERLELKIAQGSLTLFFNAPHGLCYWNHSPENYTISMSLRDGRENQPSHHRTTPRGDCTLTPRSRSKMLFNSLSPLSLWRATRNFPIALQIEMLFLLLLTT